MSKIWYRKKNWKNTHKKHWRFNCLWYLYQCIIIKHILILSVWLLHAFATLNQRIIVQYCNILGSWLNLKFSVMFFVPILVCYIVFVKWFSNSLILFQIHGLFNSSWLFLDLFSYFCTSTDCFHALFCILILVLIVDIA